MIQVVHHAWKQAIAIMISFQRGSLVEGRNNAGMTHIAEHLLFSGTKTKTRQELHRFFHSLLHEVEATTSRHEVRLFCYVDGRRLQEALELLHEMIFEWECHPDVFEREKQDLLREARTYERSDARRVRQQLDILLGMPAHEILGSTDIIASLTPKDLPRIQRFWKRTIQSAPIDILLLGAVTADHAKMVRRIFPQAHDRLRTIGWKAGSVLWVQSSQSFGLRVTHNTRHPYALFLGWIFDNRCERFMEQYAAFHGVQLPDQTLFALVGKKSIRVSEARALFTTPITKTEFTRAHRAFLKRFRTALDGQEPLDALQWFFGFRRRAYQTLPSNDPHAVYRFYQTMTYEDVSRFWTLLLSLG